MYLNLGYTLPMLISGAARDRWERTVLDPKISEIASEEDVGAQKQTALILLTTFMIALGLTVGEAFFGTLSTVFLTIDNVVADPTSIGWFWLRLGLISSASSQHWPEDQHVALPTCWDHQWTEPSGSLNVGRIFASGASSVSSIVGVSSAGSLLASVDASTLVEGLLASPGDRPRTGPWIRGSMAEALTPEIRAKYLQRRHLGWMAASVDSWHCISRSGSHPLTGRTLHTVSFSSLPTVLLVTGMILVGHSVPQLVPSSDRSSSSQARRSRCSTSDRVSRRSPDRRWACARGGAM